MVLKLKEARNRVGLTQASVAELLGTTQQTYQRWEQGKTEPSIQQLHALARIFGTTTSALLGVPQAANDRDQTLRDLCEDPRHFWGHVGIRLPMVAQTLYYPISEEGRLLIEMQMTSCEDDDMLSIITLADKELFVRAGSIARLHLVEDASDFPGEPSERDVGIIGVESGYSREAYRALAKALPAWMVGVEPDADIPSELLREAETIVATEQLDADEAYEMLTQTRVWQTDGSVYSFRSKGSVLEDAVSFVAGEMGAFVPFYDATNESEVFFPSSRIAMIEMPMHLLEGASDDFDDELIADLGEDGTLGTLQ